MHIPDNYLSPSTCAVLGAAMLPVWKRASMKVKEELTKAKLPLLGICSAFSFLIMMFNLPLPGGTTGHAVGATLAAILIGPYSAVISVTIALAIQALFFGDGGILAFGANTFNMAFIMPFVGYYIYHMIKGKGNNDKLDYIACFVASYISLNVAALLTAVEFGIQPILFKDISGMPLYCPYSLKAAIPAMLIPHMALAGVVEGLVTASVFAYVKKVSPDTIYEGEHTRVRPIYALIIGLILLSPLGLLATGTAWGEWGVDQIKELLGYVPKAMENGFEFHSIMPDYTVSGASESLGYMLSAVFGAIFIFLFFKFITAKIRKEGVKQ